MFWGSDDLEYYPQTSEAVFVFYKDSSQEGMLIGFSLPKSKIKFHLTMVRLERKFNAKKWPMPVSRVLGIKKKTMRKAFQGSKKHQRKLAHRVRDEFSEKILEVIVCRLDHSMLQDQTLQ